MQYIIGEKEIGKLRVSLESIESDQVIKYLFPILKLVRDNWIEHISGFSLAGIVNKDQLSLLSVKPNVDCNNAFKIIKTWQHCGVPFDLLVEVICTYNGNLHVTSF